MLWYASATSLPVYFALRCAAMQRVRIRGKKRDGSCRPTIRSWSWGGTGGRPAKVCLPEAAPKLKLASQFIPHGTTCQEVFSPARQCSAWSKFTFLIFRRKRCRRNLDVNAVVVPPINTSRNFRLMVTKRANACTRPS